MTASIRAGTLRSSRLMPTRVSPTRRRFDALVHGIFSLPFFIFVGFQFQDGNSGLQGADIKTVTVSKKGFSDRP